MRYIKFLTLCCIFCFVSCRTAPSTAEFTFDDSGFIPLEPGGYVYLFASQDARPLLNDLMLPNMNNKHIQQMIDMTQFVMAAVYVPGGGEAGAAQNRYRLAAWGGYPVSKAKFALGASKDWKKRRSPVSGAEYWYSANAGLSVAIIPGRALIATAAGNQTAEPDPFSGSQTAMPEGFAEFSKGAVLSCWLNSPALLINQKLEEMGLPIELPAEQLFISIFSVDAERYAAHLAIQVASEVQARALTTILTFARNFLPPSAGSGSASVLMSVLFANPPVPEGKNLNFTSAPLSAGELSLLFRIFSL